MRKNNGLLGVLLAAKSFKFDAFWFILTVVFCGKKVFLFLSFVGFNGSLLFLDLEGKDSWKRLLGYYLLGGGFGVTLLGRWLDQMVFVLSRNKVPLSCRSAFATSIPFT